MSEDRLLAVLETIRSEDAAARKRHRTSIGIIIFLVLFVVAYMSWILASMAEFDAPTITEIATAKIEARLPELEARTTAELKARAPEITDRVRDTLLEAPVALREAVEAQVQARLDTDLVEFEDVLDQELGAILDAQADALRVQYPDVADEDRLNAFLHDTMASYRDRVDATIEHTYREYARQLGELNQYFVHLQTAGILSEEEALHLEMMQTWVVLVDKHGFTKPEEIAPR